MLKSHYRLRLFLSDAFLVIGMYNFEAEWMLVNSVFHQLKSIEPGNCKVDTKKIYVAAAICITFGKSEYIEIILFLSSCNEVSEKKFNLIKNFTSRS